MGETLFLDLKDFALAVAAALLPGGLLASVSALISAGAVLVVAPVTMMFLTWVERKGVGRFQDRYGPNRVGPFGVLQPIADGIKMILKEDIIPDGSDRLLHNIMPVLAAAPVFLLFLVLPFGRGMVAADLNVGVLFFLCISSMQSPMIISAGLGARSKYSVLGSMRAVVQVLSYEIPMVIVIVAVVMTAGSMSTSEIVAAQVRDGWFVLTPWGAFGFIVFLIAATAEANRSPFDMSEAESELVAGFHTEYSGFKFALFQMAEFLSAFASAGLAATLFLGGWQGPGFLPSWAWFGAKALGVYFVLVWFRATLPRFRIDQLLALAWKFLFPLSLLVVVAAAAWYFMPLLPALVTNLVLLVGGYGLLSSWILSEFIRMNAPRAVPDAR
ncbi:MAG: NADH-quinone oxidoreductase subunit NuoH [Candidatus Coatesbacteria bacterium]